ncbi:unnamed protein product [Agarophyton chilense]|eukprot:gb/GEZJ01002475.1/.p1 GENE.gb/GEZJ01002475.1/~~gb/GEZJ01002475.1/.p1  ORF type:complete len:681 (-),score=94.55 gb/GEZJ01002475.1/:1980-4022(-)
MPISPGDQLIKAARKGDESCMLRLLEQEVHVDYQGQKQLTALLWAARCGHVNVIELVLKHGGNVHHVNHLNRTALSLAAGFGQHHATEILIRAGANVNHADSNGYTPIRNAACFGHACVLSKLMEAGAHVDCVDKFGLSALSTAVRRERLEVLRVLIEAGADLEIPDRFGRTALFTHHLTCVDMLCKADANVQHIDHDGDTPLTYAALHAESCVVKRLLDAGANPYHVNCFGATALMLAAACGNESTVGVLLEANTDVNHVNRQGASALMWAVHHMQAATVKTLLNSRAHINLIDKRGNTALHYALDRFITDRSQQVASILVENGADLLIANDKDDTPISVLPNNSNLRRTLLEQFDDDIEKMWYRCVLGIQGVLTSEQLFDVLRSDNILSLGSLMAAHNLLLLLVRTDQFTKRELQYFRGSPGYLLQNVYLPVSKLNLSKEEYMVATIVIRHAEAHSFIPECSSVWVNHAIEVRSEIRENRVLLQNVMENVMDGMCLLHQRVHRIEEWTDEATEEFKRLAQNSDTMMSDLKQLCDNLNNLHRNLRQQQRRLIYTAIARTVLSVIPVFGKALCDAAYAGVELFCGLTTEDAVEIGNDLVKGTVSLGIALDMSDPRYVRQLTSSAFMLQLEAIDRERLEFVVAQSNFKSVEALHRDLLATAEASPGQTVEEPLQAASSSEG